jgi:hypothetical protein
MGKNIILGRGEQLGCLAEDQNIDLWKILPEEFFLKVI